MNRAVNFLRTALVILVALGGAAAGLRAADLPLLIKSESSYSQRIPVISLDPDGAQAARVWINLKWTPVDAKPGQREQLDFQFTGNAPAHVVSALRQDLWTASLAGALAWQEGWRSARWEVPDPPYCDADGSGAALAVGLLATAAAVEFPESTVIIASVNPDGTLGPVSRMERRLEAAATAGARRVVVPQNQRLAESSPGNFIDVEARARQLGLQPVAVANLSDAVSTALGHSLQPSPDLSFTPTYSSAVFAQLLDRCQAQIASLNKSRPDWPQTTEALARVNANEVTAWKKVFRNYEDGMDAFRAGRLYAATCRFRDAIGGISVLAAQRKSADTFDPVAYRQKCRDVRTQIAEEVAKSGSDKNDVQSGLLMAEQLDVLTRMDAWLEGAQVAVSQTFAADSRATPAQQAAAQFVMRFATDSSEHQLRTGMTYADLLPLAGADRQVSAFDRAPIWLSQLQPTHLALAEHFSQGIRMRAHEHGVNLLFDPMLAAYSQINRRMKEKWERGGESGASDPAGSTNAAAVVSDSDIGFIPGPAYGSSDDTTPREIKSRISDVARCLAWVNGYTEMALLSQKYLVLGGALDVRTLDWNSANRAKLTTLLNAAETGAKRGIALAQQVDVDTTVLAMIYENAESLRDSRSDELQLESLRQYWRCALLGNLCYQLAYIPRVAPPPAPTDAPPKAEIVSPPRANPPAITQPSALEPPADEPDPAPAPAPAAPPRAQVVRPAPDEPEHVGEDPDMEPPVPGAQNRRLPAVTDPALVPIPEPDAPPVAVPVAPPAIVPDPVDEPPVSVPAPAAIPRAEIVRPAAPDEPATDPVIAPPPGAPAPLAPDADGTVVLPNEP